MLLGGSAQRPSVAFGPDGTVYFNEYEAGMAAATPSGTLLWEFEASGRLISLGLAIGRDETIYFSNEDEFYAVSKTGDLRWSIRLGSWGASSPLMAKSGAIYFASSFPNPRRTAVDTGLASSAHPWPLPRGDVRRSGRSPVLEPANGFSRTRQMTNQTMELLIDGPPSHTYSIEQSQDFRVWQTVTHGASSNGVVRIVVPTPAGVPRRFFRAARP